MLGTELPAQAERKAGTTSHHGPYVQGNTRATMVGTTGSKLAIVSEFETLSQFGFESATRLHEVGIASNRISYGAACTRTLYTARQAMVWWPEDGGHLGAV